MLLAVSLMLLCVQGLKTPHRLRPCDPSLVGAQRAISMATEVNDSDVHMATAAVGTEVGGGGYGGVQERGGGLDADAFSGCLESFRECRPLTNQKWA